MAMTGLVLKSKFNSNGLLLHLPPPPPPIKFSTTLKFQVIRTSPNLRIKCLMTNQNLNANGEKQFTNRNRGEKDNDWNNQMMWSAIQKVITVGVLFGVIFFSPPSFFRTQHISDVVEPADECKLSEVVRYGARCTLVYIVLMSIAGASFSGKEMNLKIEIILNHLIVGVLIGLLIYTPPQLLYKPMSHPQLSDVSLDSNSKDTVEDTAEDTLWAVGRFGARITIVTIVLSSIFLSDGSDSSVPTDIERTSVLKLQVGVLGKGRSLLRDLNRLAEVADTSTPQDLSYILQETSLTLLRHHDYCISGYSSVDVKKSIEECEERFNQLSFEERGKFEEETTLFNVNNIKKQNATSKRPIGFCNGFCNEYIVITIIVVARGIHELSPNNKLKEALLKLTCIPSSRIKAAAVFCTPQNENDILTERKLLQDYSLLRPLFVPSSLQPIT